MTILSNDDLNRYSRQIVLNEIGLEGQKKLLSAKVLVIGAGGLGSPALLLLAAAGVGNIGIVDFDKVDISNLQRQILYDELQIGILKAYAAKEKLAKINSKINIFTYPEKLSINNALNILSNYDFVIDGTDNFPTRYLINDICVALDKPFVMGAIHKFEGQVSVFNYKNSSGNPGPTYRCLYPVSPKQEQFPNCAQLGVLGSLTSIIGSIQANEVIKMITGSGNVLSGEMLIFNILNNSFFKLKIKRNEVSVKKSLDISNNLKDYQPNLNAEEIKHFDDEKYSINPSNLYRLFSKEKKIKVIDICTDLSLKTRIPNSIKMNYNELIAQNEQFFSGFNTIICCEIGIKSSFAVNELLKKYKIENLFSLKGGLLAWTEFIKTESNYERE